MKAVHIKIASVMTIAAVLNSADAEAIDAALSEVTQGMPDYFDNEFAIVDIGPLALEPDSCNWTGLADLFHSHNLQLIAIRNAAPALHGEIIAAGLALDLGQPVAGGKAIEPAPAPEAAPAIQAAITPEPVAAAAAVSAAGSEELVAAAVSTEATRTMFIDTPVRAGQRIYARGANLIITATVNNGAEIIADGSIHVYGAMRGRVLAGASGDITARIYASSMQPELVSIAGIYRVFDEGFPAELANRTVQLRLIEDKMDISAVG